MFTASQVLYGLRNTRNRANSVVIAAYRKEPMFAGDVTWEMVLAITPFDGRPCHVLWDEDTVRYHIVPRQRKDGESQMWGIDCYDGAQYWDRPPVFLVGLGISKLSEEEIWNVVKDVPIEFRDSAQQMFKDWVWDLLPALADAKAIYPQYGQSRTVSAAEQPILNILGRPIAKCKQGVYSWRF